MTCEPRVRCHHGRGEPPAPGGCGRRNPVLRVVRTGAGRRSHRSRRWSRGSAPTPARPPTIRRTAPDLDHRCRDAATAPGHDRRHVDVDHVDSTSTTSTLPHPTGWAGFDEIISYDLLINGDTSASVAVMIEGELVHASAFGVRVGRHVRSHRARRPLPHRQRLEGDHRDRDAAARRGRPAGARRSRR